MLCHDGGEDATAYPELRRQACVARRRGGNDVVENFIGDGFMEFTLIAKRPNVEFQTFEFDAAFVRDVVEVERGEIWLTGFGTQAGEFRDLHVNHKVAMRCGIGKNIELRRWADGRFVAEFG